MPWYSPGIKIIPSLNLVDYTAADRSATVPSKTYQNCKNITKLYTSQITLFTMEICKYRFLKCQFYFSYIWKKIANIRKYRKKNDFYDDFSRFRLVRSAGQHFSDSSKYNRSIIPGNYLVATR